MDRVVPALGGADRPGRAGVVGPGGERVVGALAVDLADRVDRRQVDHVEAHRGHALQPLGRGLEVAAGDLAGVRVAGRALGAREELVPAAVERPRRGRRTPDTGLRRSAARAAGAREHGRGQLAGLELRPAGPPPAGRCRGRPRSRRAGPWWLLGGRPAEVLREHPLEQQRALEEHQLHVDAGRDLDARRRAARWRAGRTRHAPRTSRRRAGRASPTPRAGRRGSSSSAHPDRWPAAAVRRGQHHLGAQLVVPLAEHRRRHRERLTHGRLGACLPWSTRGMTSRTGMRPTMPPHSRTPANSPNPSGARAPLVEQRAPA